jgi:hypothetical protein
MLQYGSDNKNFRQPVVGKLRGRDHSGDLDVGLTSEDDIIITFTGQNLRSVSAPVLTIVSILVAVVLGFVCSSGLSLELGFLHSFQVS